MRLSPFPSTRIALWSDVRPSASPMPGKRVCGRSPPNGEQERLGLGRIIYMRQLMRRFRRVYNLSA